MVDLRTRCFNIYIKYVCKYRIMQSFEQPLGCFDVHICSGQTKDHVDWLTGALIFAEFPCRALPANLQNTVHGSKVTATLLTFLPRALDSLDTDTGSSASCVLHRDPWLPGLLGDFIKLIHKMFTYTF